MVLMSDGRFPQGSCRLPEYLKYQTRGTSAFTLSSLRPSFDSDIVIMCLARRIGSFFDEFKKPSCSTYAVPLGSRSMTVALHLLTSAGSTHNLSIIQTRPPQERHNADRLLLASSCYDGFIHEVDDLVAVTLPFFNKLQLVPFENQSSWY